jgi:SpoVK/Ycf46/Vps4 family AAA+-type ATPase
VRNVRREDVRAIEYKDFILALKSIKASVCKEDLKAYEAWEAKYGSS